MAGDELREVIPPRGPALGGPQALDEGDEDSTSTAILSGKVGVVDGVTFRLHQRPMSVAAAAMSTLFGEDSLPRRVLRHLRQHPEAGEHVKVGGKSREKARRVGGPTWEAFKAADRKHRKLR